LLDRSDRQGRRDLWGLQASRGPLALRDLREIWDLVERIQGLQGLLGRRGPRGQMDSLDLWDPVGLAASRAPVAHQGQQAHRASLDCPGPKVPPGPRVPRALQALAVRLDLRDRQDLWALWVPLEGQALLEYSAAQGLLVSQDQRGR